MKFMTLVKSSETKNGPPPPAMIQAVQDMEAESVKNGTLVSNGGFFPTGQGAARFSMRDGNITHTDGPFTEAKEVVGGWAIYEYKSREDAMAACQKAMEATKKHWPGWEGEIELRPMYG
jgi:hypothetical protein